MSKGSVLIIALAHSFTVLMYLLISGTCSSIPVMFTFMPCNSICFLIHSNCQSLSICLILNPCQWHVSIICCIDFIIVDLVLFFIISAVPKCIACDMVIMKGILLMFIISIAKVTSPCSSSNPLGRLSSVLSIGVSRVVFPFRLPKLGPSMSSACMMSSLVMGQFEIRSFSTYLT